MIQAAGGPAGERQAYILAVRWPEEAATTLNALREAFFPAQRNYLQAHLTLFHALPGQHLAQVQSVLAESAAATQVFDLAFVGPISLGHGVALRVRSAALEALRARLASAFWPFLGPQDRQGFRGHVTVQNKVSRDEARRTLDALTMAWNPDYVAQATALSLSRYAGGPWEHVADYPFGQSDNAQDPGRAS